MVIFILRWISFVINLVSMTNLPTNCAPRRAYHLRDKNEVTTRRNIYSPPKGGCLFYVFTKFNTWSMKYFSLSGSSANVIMYHLHLVLFCENTFQSNKPLNS